MRRLPLQLLSLCLCGALLLRLCQGNEDEYEYEYDFEYDSTATPDYDNSTFEYLYFGNFSNVDYNSFVIMEPKSEGTQESNENRNTAPETGLPSLLLIGSLSVHKLYEQL
ncbi:hypothetical protein GJAV_G00008510 [Gymnothorax javanicus]|nr:hypothetical protein GJAV_G00008510 [Gymnothorax javanicus]